MLLNLHNCSPEVNYFQWYLTKQILILDKCQVYVASSVSKVSIMTLFTWKNCSYFPDLKAAPLPAFFKEGHDEGWGHYSICFPDKGIAIVIMTNNDNGESIFKELLATAIGDIFTPWEWENYIPYN